MYTTSNVTEFLPEQRRFFRQRGIHSLSVRMAAWLGVNMDKTIPTFGRSSTNGPSFSTIFDGSTAKTFPLTPLKPKRTTNFSFTPFLLLIMFRDSLETDTFIHVVNKTERICTHLEAKKSVRPRFFLRQEMRI